MNTEQENRDLAKRKVGDLFLEYLKFYAGSPANLVFYPARGFIADKYNKELPPEVMDACVKVDPLRTRHILENKSRLVMPKHLEQVVQLETNILADENFVASRQATKTDTTPPSADDIRRTALMMESHGDAMMQGDMAKKLAGGVHRHVVAIHALRTKAAKLGLTHQVDQLVAQLNSSTRSR